MLPFKKILWLLPDSGNYVFNSTAAGLEILGVDVELFSYRDEVFNVGIKEVERNILSKVENGSYDFVLLSLYESSYELLISFLNQVNEFSPLALLLGDDEIYLTTQSIYFAHHVDVVITSDFIGRFIYDQIGTPSVYYALPALDLDAPPVMEKDIDVSFVGDCTKADRMEYISYLRDNGIEVKTFGRGGEGGYVSREEYRRIFSRSRINLNFTKSSVPRDVIKYEPWRQSVRQVKGRPLEIVKNNGFCLTENVFGLEQILEPKKEIDVFEDKYQLLDKVSYYLGNPDKVAAMSELADNRIKSDFDEIGHLESAFLKVYESIQSERHYSRNVLPSCDYFNSSIARCNFYLFLRLLLARKLTYSFQMVPYFFQFKRGYFEGILCALGNVVFKWLK